MVSRFAGSRRGFGALVAGALLLGAGLRLYGLGAEVFWLDEIHALRFSDAPSVGELIRSTVTEDRTPPLYYLMLRYWRVPFQGAAWTRLFSAIAGVGSIAVGGVLAYFVGGRKLSLLAMLLMALSQYQIYYSQEARVYAWLVLACVSSWTLLLWAVKGPTSVFRWFAYGIVTVFGIYLHYPFWFSLVAQGLWFLSQHVRKSETGRKAIRPFAITVAFVSVASLPMLYLLKWQAGTGGIAWIPPLSLMNLFMVFRSMACGVLVPMSLWVTGVGIAVAVLCWVRFLLPQRGETIQRSSIVFATLIPLVLTIGVSFYRPLIYYGQRYLIVIQPFFVIGMAGGILKFRQWVSSATLSIVLAVWAFLVLTTYIGTEKRRYDLAASFIAGQARPADRVLVVPDYSYMCLAFFRDDVPPGLNWNQENWREEVTSVLASGGRIWGVAVVPEMTPAERAILGYAEPKYLSVVAEKPFLRVVRYERK